ncbi:MAG: 1,4-alpha-glucan branching protein GlgB [Sideroxydans sp.]|nr:1,4-alpha-glucan branching protein GlgB [Sideroxydans sp.]
MPNDSQHKRAILEARHHDPFSYLGLHQLKSEWVLRVFHPYATDVAVFDGAVWQPLARVDAAGLFKWRGKKAPPSPCHLQLNFFNHVIEIHDAYSFASSITEHDLYLFSEGRLEQSYRMLGAHHLELQGVWGVRFAVWAPNAERVSVVGDFNGWDGRVYPMRALGSSGVWEIFVPDIGLGEFYKFEIRNRQTGELLIKTDPYGFSFEMRPGTASRVTALDGFQWRDHAWLEQRAAFDWQHQPLNVYEVHAGSWKRHWDGRFYNFRELAESLVPYVQEMGFTHIELMPVSEHPLDESWGYQTTGYFGVTSRYGTPDDFRYFVESCHIAGIGVILDWVPAHFPKDAFALARFDGTALFEHEDPRLGEHQDWGTLIFNYGRNEVRNFLMANAHYWLNEFHIDGIRVDAVASMLYLDYSRKQGQWLPNKFGGRENLEAVEFFRDLNVMTHERFPGSLTIAEESTSWPMVSRPTYLGGLGFSMKWNMGWMNDTLDYIKRDPVHRRYYQNMLTFGQLYAYTENFVLPFSHDEVVHGKRSLLDKMPGDGWQKFANLRLLFTYQMTAPGKKLNFMGNEIAQGREWQVGAEIDWYLLGRGEHSGVKALLGDVNRLYRELKPLHELDFSHEGFAWMDCDNADQSVLAYRRMASDGSYVIVLLNFTPVPRVAYRLGVPHKGGYREIFNSDSHYYGGSNMGNGFGLYSGDIAWHGEQQSIEVTLPPLAGIVLERMR